MSGLGKKRIGWLIRRLSRMYPAEAPYRLASVARAAMQRHGWADASCEPARASDASFGHPWVCVPQRMSVNAEAVIVAVERILQDGVKVFDITVPLRGGSPEWNRDPKTGANIEMKFGLYIDFRDLGGGIDIKYLWELNRHVWWVTIAQAYAVSGDQKYLAALSSLLESWLSACPYPLGANWSSPVEHGIRLINWSIVWNLIGGAESQMFALPVGQKLLDRWMVSVYQHLRFASDNYSFYSSADNHLIGEAAGVFVGAHTWDLWPQVRVLRVRAKKILEEEILKQFSVDGVNLEQAICYQRFSLEFLLASLLCGEVNDDGYSSEYTARMRSGMEFMASMMDCRGRLPAIGDSDDGIVFRFVDGSRSPYESLLRVGATIFDSPALIAKLYALGGTAFKEHSWLVVPEKHSTPCSTVVTSALPERFEKGGYIVLGSALHSPQEFRITMDVGPLGYNRIAGHGHADALSLLLACQGEDFLIDPGTYCYNAAPELRHYFRGTSAHNTVMIDDVDQSVYGGSFLWLGDVVTTMHYSSDDGVIAVVEASHDGYMRLEDPVRHFRKVVFNRDRLEVLVEDRFSCAQPHRCTLHWHFSLECAVSHDGERWIAVREAGTLGIQIEPSDFIVSVVKGIEKPPLGWVSRKFYERQPTQVLVATGIIEHSSTIRTRFVFSSSVE